MESQIEPRKPVEQGDLTTVALLTDLCTALKHMQAAQNYLIKVLRPTHDRRLLSQATDFAEACGERLQEIQQRLVAFRQPAT